MLNAFFCYRKSLIFKILIKTRTLYNINIQSLLTQNELFILKRLNAESCCHLIFY
jgi:hypothetical protein